MSYVKFTPILDKVSLIFFIYTSSSLSNSSFNKSDNDLEVEYEVIKLNEETDRVKPGPKPKQLKAMEVYGYEVGRGNNKKIVVPDDIYKLANIGCNDREIAAWFNIDENTLRYNFSEVMEKGRIELKTRLRRTLISTALGGNAVLLIFLAKNMGL